MGAHKSYNDQIVGENDILLYMFECKSCKERWFSSFCQCPKCGKVRKFKILSSEQAAQVIRENQLIQQSVYGLLLEDRRR